MSILSILRRLPEAIVAKLQRSTERPKTSTKRCSSTTHKRSFLRERATFARPLLGICTEDPEEKVAITELLSDERLI